MKPINKKKNTSAKMTKPCTNTAEYANNIEKSKGRTNVALQLMKDRTKKKNK